MAAPDIVGGGFRDCAGNVLKNCTMTIQLSAPAVDKATGLTQICPGEICSYSLDSNGNIIGAQPVWSNDLLTPTTTYYTITVYTEQGQRAWGPNRLVLSDIGGYVYLSQLVPNNPT